MFINGKWKNPAADRCDRKQAYRTWKQAEKIAEKQSNKTGELIIAYQCFECSWFHIGHADKSQKNIRELPDLPSLPTTCPRCKQPINESRREAARRTGSPTVYCSVKCKQKWSRKLRYARRITRKPQNS
jgi:hypothetical protein